ncbi:MAG: phosphoadenylyl-sulfate reductase [Bacteroidia bacterium]|nr:phosphoadenylyl-sulfate reductase [Bacteroidia bacterium]
MSVISQTSVSVEGLNQIFEPLPPHRRLQLLYEYFPPEEIMATTSFGASSAFLLHLFSRVRHSQKIFFIDTTFHFPETLRYKELLMRKLSLNIQTVKPDPGVNAVTRKEKSWVSDPNLCCTVNKVLPLEEVKSQHRIWISGLMGYQNPFRKNLRVFEEQDGVLKFHPLIDVKEVDVRRYLTFFNLPFHPLEEKGFGSIGCTHCTAKGKDRAGRWIGKSKTECGLHLSFTEFSRVSISGK